MIRIFISQPMRDKSEEEILAERERCISIIKERYKNDDIEIIDSFIKEAPDDATPLWFMAKSIELLSTADVAYFVEGWEKARGCRIEHECAISYGINIIY